MNELKWFSQFGYLKEALKNDKIQFLIVPFIQLKALKELIYDESFINDCIVISRWNKEDLLSGVSDINIFPYLKEKKIKLYINKNLHLKLYVFNSKKALLSSGNLINNGLGLSNSGNYELGAFHELSSFDYKIINQILNESTLVDNSLFEQLSNILVNVDDAKINEIDLKIYKSESLEFNMCLTPEYFIDNYISENWNEKLVNDMYLFSIPIGLTKDEMIHLLKIRFSTNNLIKEIIEYIQENSPIGKGVRPIYQGVQNGIIRHWLKNKYPNLNNINSGINSLQEWLPFCKPEINVSVTIPGQNSRVFNWEE